MKSKNLKVAYSTRFQKNSTLTVPKLQMEGKWLEELGFSIGSTVMVEYEEGSIRIRPLTKDEQTLIEQQELTAALRRKEKELRSMQASYETLSKVAETSQSYGKSTVRKSC